MVLAAKADSKSSWAILGLLRFALAFIVVGGHIYNQYAPPGDWTHCMWWAGPGCVYSFFLISGYSIAASLERDESRFYMRRVVRIWPLYLAAIGLMCVAIAVTHGHFMPPHGLVKDAPSGLAFLGTLLMAQSFLMPVNRFDGPMWSLSIEWWLYMVAPALRRIATPILLVVVAVSAWRFTLDPIRPYIVGCWVPLVWLWITGFIYYRHKDKLWSLLVLAVPCAATYFIGGQLSILPIYTIIALAFARYVTIRSAKAIAAMNWLADVSYPLYLVHTPVIVIMSVAGVQNSAELIAGPIATAAVMLQAIDYPIRRRTATARQAAVRIDGGSGFTPSYPGPLRAGADPIRNLEAAPTGGVGLPSNQPFRSATAETEP